MKILPNFMDIGRVNSWWCTKVFPERKCMRESAATAKTIPRDKENLEARATRWCQENLLTPSNSRKAQKDVKSCAWSFMRLTICHRRKMGLRPSPIWPLWFHTPMSMSSLMLMGWSHNPRYLTWFHLQWMQHFKMWIKFWTKPESSDCSGHSWSLDLKVQYQPKIISVSWARAIDR